MMLRGILRGWLPPVVVAVALLCIPGITAAQAVLRGVARDSTGRGVANVEVILEGTDQRTRTDTSGRYALPARPGDYAALFRALGYHAVRETLRLTEGDTLTRDVTLLVSDAQQLEAVNVRAPTRRNPILEGFEERRKLGLGSYIDSVRLRKEEGRRLGDLVRQMRGIKVIIGPRGQLWAVNPTKTNLDGSPSCFSSVYLDRVLLFRSGSRDTPPDLGRDIQISNLDAIEWYSGSAQVPAEFGIRNSDCGVLVLWTRRG